jgi:nucleoside-diphosphate-sugar epimerase
VTIFDDFSVGSKWNLREIVNHVTIVKDDVRDFSMAKRVNFGQDFVFNIAANASVPISSGSPKYDFERAHAQVCRLLTDVIKKENGVRPKVDLRTGLAQIVEWNKSSNLQKRRDVLCE